MAIIEKSFLTNVRGKELSYSDDFYRLRGKKIVPANSFSYYLYNVMTDVVDTKTNNYSNLFLTKKQTNDSWLECVPPTDKFDNANDDSSTDGYNTKTVVTMIAFSPYTSKSEWNGSQQILYHDFFDYEKSNIGQVLNEYDEQVQNTYLYFQYNSSVAAGEIPTNIPVVHKPYIVNSTTIDNEQFQMTVQFTDSNTCVITHSYGGVTYYLAYAYTNCWAGTGKSWRYAQVKRGVWSRTYGDITLLWTNDPSYSHVWNYEQTNIQSDTANYEFYTKIQEEQDNGSVKDVRYYLARGYASANSSTTYTDPSTEEQYQQFDPKDDVVILTTKETYDRTVVLSKEQGVYVPTSGELNVPVEYADNALYPNSTIIHLLTTNTYSNFSNVINTSTVKYNRANIIGEINSENSYWDLATQVLLHHEYNNDNGINIIPLKNTVSYQGNTILGHYVNNRYNNDGTATDFRTYKSLNTGFNQEKGTGNISLNFVFSDQEYEVNEGEDIIIDSNYLELPEDTSIPIRDTAFVMNGAFGSDVPWFADKFKMMQRDNTEIDNGTYLCTWLKKDSLEDTNPQWYDRYYNPATTTPARALTEPEITRYKGTEDYDKNLENLCDYGIADFPSKMTIKPNREYKFSRLSKEMVDEVMTNLDPKTLNVVTNQNNKKVNLNDGISFDGTEWRRIETPSEETITSINFNTDMYIDPNKRIGISLFGSSIGKGFSITNRTDVSPHHYYADAESIYLLNNKWEVCNKLSIKELYNDTILKLIYGDLFDDVIIISPLYLYLLTFDLKVKTRMALTSQTKQEDDLAIYNLTQDGVLAGFKNKQGDPFRLLNYPFGDNFKIIPWDRNKVIDNGKHKKAVPASGSIKLPRKFTYLKKRFILNEQQGTKPLHSNVAGLFLESKSVFYNNNLYIPFGMNIIKVIFCPDQPKDAVFTDVIRKEYPAYARVLNDGEDGEEPEFYRNFYDSSEDETTVKEINSIFVDENGHIFGLNYDTITMSYDKEHIFGIFSPEKFVEEGEQGIYTVYTQSLPRLLNHVPASQIQSESDWWSALATKEPQSYFVSYKSFDMIKSNEEGYVAMVINRATKTDDTEAEFRIYDKHKELKYKAITSYFDSIVSLESYNYITENDVEKKVFALIIAWGKTLYKIEFDTVSGKETRTILQHITNTTPAKYYTGATNNDANMRGKSKNNLHFKLHLPSVYLFNQSVSMNMPLDDFVRGWYNINVSIDLLKADFTIRLNDHIYKQLKYDAEVGGVTLYDSTSYSSEKNNRASRYDFFTPYASVSSDAFNHTYYLGTMPKDYGFTMNDVLKNAPDHDPYTCKDSKMENVMFMTKSLSLHEYQALRLYNRNINTIILTLPTVERTSVDEMVRFFKYSGGGAIANNVKIIVDGHGLTDQNDIDSLKGDIFEALDGNMDATIRINEITFITEK